MTALPRRAQNRLERERRILDAALTVFGAMGYLNSYGPQLADELISAADPFAIEHGVLEL